MKIPNDLPEGGTQYFQEYALAGGSEHAAKSYAVACCQRDQYATRLDAITTALFLLDVGGRDRV